MVSDEAAEVGHQQKYLILKTSEPMISTHYAGIKEKVLDKGKVSSKLIPLNFGGFEFIGVKTSVTDPSCKRRLFVIS